MRMTMKEKAAKMSRGRRVRREMEKRAMLVFLLLASMLASCVTKRVTMERVMVHDTVVVSRVDTVRVATHSSHNDTVREMMVRVVTLRMDSANTDTVRVETVRERWRSVYVSDSSGIYQHLADSVRAAVEKERSREIKKTTKAGKGILIWWIVIAVVAVGVWIIKKK